MGIQGFLSKKFLSGKSKNWFLSSLTLLAILGVVVSVMAFVVVEGVMSGFNQDLQRKILGFSAHLTLHGNIPKEKILRNKLVKSVHTLLEGEAILRTEDGQAQGVRLRGIQAGELPPLDTLKIRFEEGEDWDSFLGRPGELPGILIGSELTTTLGILPALGEVVELLYPIGTVGPTGEIEPNLRKFRVLGTFQSGYFDFDNKFVLLPLEEGEALLGDQGEKKLAIYLKDPMKAESLRNKLLQMPGVDSVSSWSQEHRRLFSALRLEKMGMSLVLGLMLVLSSFNILSLLMMLVYERRRDIALLRALGCTRRAVGAILVKAGLRIGLLGGVVGITLGSGMGYWISRSKLQLPATYYLEALPFRFYWPVLVAALGIAVLISIIAAWLPANEGKKLSIVEALRYE